MWISAAGGLGHLQGNVGLRFNLLDAPLHN
jgi:hypothetical protein